MNELFITKQNISYDLRDDTILEIPRYNTVTYGFNSLTYQVTRLWKSLDCSVNTLPQLPNSRKWLTNGKALFVTVAHVCYVVIANCYISLSFVI